MDQASAIGAKAPKPEVQPFSKPYASYALLLLTLTYMMSHVDRKILAILLEPIKQDLHLSDTYLGFLTGFAFALFNATLGVPLAMLADRSNRRNIIAATLTIFSGFTFVCGLAAAPWQLLAARFAVGAGEAGTSPASHSMIADTVPPGQRSRAMGVYALGGPIGTMIAFLGGGLLAEHFGWRGAFFGVAIPGLILALVVLLTLKDPPRGGSDGIKPPTTKTGILESLRTLWSIPSYRHIVLGTSLAVFGSFGVSTWAPSFLSRSFAMGSAEIGLTLAMIIGVGGTIGVLGTGIACDRLGARDVRWNMWLLCVIQVVCFPFVMAFYFQHQAASGLAFYILPAMFGTSFVASTLAMIQTLAPVRMRAMSSSYYLLAVNLIGAGLGPQVIGTLSDVFRPAYGQESLRYALMVASLAWPWSAIHFALAARTLRVDIERANAFNAQAPAAAG